MATAAHVHKVRVPLFEEVGVIDWNDVAGASRLTQTLIRRFAEDKPLFRKVLHAVIEDPHLWSQCEEEVVEDKIVLWDDEEKGLRIRLRISTAPQQRLAHCHRFSFTNLVLRGSYLHWGYTLDGEFTEATDPNDFKTVLLHEDRAGDCFTIFHEALHSTPFTQPGTVSLVLRGNPVKERAPVMFKEPRARQRAFEERAAAPRSGRVIEPEEAATGDMFYRHTTAPDERMPMSGEKFRHWCRWLEAEGLV